MKSIFWEKSGLHLEGTKNMDLFEIEEVGRITNVGVKCCNISTNTD
jgi:hypothetical protein